MKALLEKGRGNTQEIEVALFGHCNLHCDFCFQRNTDQAEVLRENIYKASEDIINHLKTINLSNKNVVNLRTYGGELFTNVTENFVDDYIGYAIKIKNYVKQFNLELKTHWTTNLVHKTDKLRYLHDKLIENGIDCRIITSFDFEGRFKGQQLQQWKDNLERYKDLIDLIVIVQTKPNIDAFFKREDEYKELYKSFKIMWEHYVPDINWESNLPSDDDIIKLYKHLLKYYPKSTPVTAFFNKVNCMTCECANSFRWINGNIITHCRDMISIKDGFRSGKELYQQQASYITRKGCLLCEYFQKCPLSCWMFRDFKYTKEHNVCMYKELFKWVEKENIC